ncbi:MAG: NAD(+)/NADH kinase [Acidilobaceae archaeon]
MEPIGIIVKRESSLAEEVALKVVKVLDSSNVKFLIEENVEYKSLSDYSKFNLQDYVPEKLIVIGGDGTLLRTLLKIQDKTPIIMGVRAGKRGFLLDVERYEVEERVKDFLHGRYKVIEYPRLSVYANNRKLYCILNDSVVISKMAKMVRLTVSIDGQTAMRIDGDGVVVSTTVGSTAYGLSAGGPIIDPRLNVILVVPLNPVQLHLRPIVIPGDSLIEISLTAQSNEAYLSLDGQIVEELRPGSTIAIGPCPISVRIARFRWWENFYEKLYTRVLTYW